MSPPPRPLAIALLTVFAPLAAASCASSPGVGDAGDALAPSDASPDGPAASDGGALRWYYTCGYPVCPAPGHDGGPDGGSGLPPCTTQHAGDACGAPGDQCDPGSSCGERLQCATSDPTKTPGGCPISSRAFKQDVEYLDAKAIERLAAQLERVRIARYAYRADPTRTRLGFVIEDGAPEDAVVPARDMVDLYGYTTMVLAAMKDQSRRLERQAEEIAALRREVAAARRK